MDRFAAKGQKGNEIFLGVYRQRSATYYLAFAGLRRDFDEGMVYTHSSDANSFGLDLISLKRIPMVWQSDIGIHYGACKEKNGLAYVGQIFYMGGNGSTTPESYYPREKLDKGPASGFAYLFEAITTKDLQRLGYSRISTTFKPERQRKEQVERVGLRTVVEIDIREWLKGMGRGIKASLDKAIGTGR
ncbi:MAG: hypothetical protein KGH69_04350 [Candidatus Micrarchaeota archaeon]|nr:hypothetical protein [Candidatus Micrarchaeota archaeon]